VPRFKGFPSASALPLRFIINTHSRRAPGSTPRCHNAQWRAPLQPCAGRGCRWLEGVLNYQWNARSVMLFSPGHPRRLDRKIYLAPRTSERLRSENHRSRAKTLDFPGGRRRGRHRGPVFASTYWSLPTRQQRVLTVNRELLGRANGGYLLKRPGPRHLTIQPDTGSRPVQYYEYTPPATLAGMSGGFASKPGGRFTGSRACSWEKTVDKELLQPLLTFRDCGPTAHFSLWNSYYYTRPALLSLPPDTLVPYMTRRIICRTRFYQYQLRYHRQAQRRSGSRAFPSNPATIPFGHFATTRRLPL